MVFEVLLEKSSWKLNPPGLNPTIEAFYKCVSSLNQLQKLVIPVHFSVHTVGGMVVYLCSYLAFLSYASSASVDSGAYPYMCASIYMYVIKY